MFCVCQSFNKEATYLLITAGLKQLKRFTAVLAFLFSVSVQLRGHHCKHKLKTFLFWDLSTTAHRDCLLFCVIKNTLTYLLTY